MDTATSITTAARRIARDANTSSPLVKTWYDADGHPVEAAPADMWFTDPRPDLAGLVLCKGTRGEERMTYRAAQDLIDAYATDDPIGYLNNLMD